MRLMIAAIFCAALPSAVPAHAADAPAGYVGRERHAPPPAERHVLVEEPAWRRVVVEEQAAEPRRRHVVEEPAQRWERRVYLRHERRDYETFQEPGPRGRWREEDATW